MPKQLPLLRHIQINQQGLQGVHQTFPTHTPTHFRARHPPPPGSTEPLSLADCERKRQEINTPIQISAFLGVSESRNRRAFYPCPRRHPGAPTLQRPSLAGPWPNLERTKTNAQRQNATGPHAMSAPHCYHETLRETLSYISEELTALWFVQSPFHARRSAKRKDNINTPRHGIFRPLLDRRLPIPRRCRTGLELYAMVQARTNQVLAFATHSSRTRTHRQEVFGLSDLTLFLREISLLFGIDLTPKPWPCPRINHVHTVAGGNYRTPCTLHSGTPVLTGAILDPTCTSCIMR